MSAFLVSVDVPAQLRQRGEIIGLIFGALILPLVWIGHAIWGDSELSPAEVALPMVLLSMAAGAIGCALWRGHVTVVDGSFAPRVGIHAGLVAAIVAGALRVAVSTLHTFGNASVVVPAILKPFSFLWLMPKPYQVLTVALLGLPPSIFFGMVGAFATMMWRERSTSAKSDGESPSAVTKRIATTLFIVILVLSACGYLSPFTLPFRIKQRFEFTSVAVAPIPAPVVLAAAPPKWRYEKPEGFDTAEADRITVSTQRSFDGVQSDRPVARSPDQHLFAYFDSGRGGALQIRDLETLDVVAGVGISGQPSGLTWARDSSKLLLRTKSDTERLFVFDIGNKRLTLLPQPVNGNLPQGIPFWWDVGEVLFTGRENPLVLSLDDLRVRPLSESPKWGSSSKENQEAIRCGTMPLHVAANPRWKIVPQPVVRHYTLPAKGSVVWSMEERLNLTFIDAQRAYRNEPAAADLNIGDAVLGTNDGSKVIRIRGSQATVFYFGLRDEPANRINITMPDAPDPALSSLLAKAAVCVFVCGPLINPLNGKTVGPNREDVKGIARFSMWSKQRADLWINEEFLPIRPGDVVADPHTWEKGVPRTVGDYSKNEWFAVIEKLDQARPPSKEEAPHLDRELSIAVDSGNGADRLERILPVESSKPVAVPPEPEANKAASAVKSMVSSFISLNDAEKSIIAFLNAHHAKSSHGDVNGLVSDYSDRVDYFDHGVVAHEFIRKDELAYRTPGTTVTENIITQPVLAALGGDIYGATYSISFNRVQPNGHWTKGTSEIEIHMEIKQGHPLIVYQRATASHQEKGP